VQSLGRGEAAVNFGIAIGAAVASSICAAISNVLQHRMARRGPAGRGLRLRLVWHLMHQPVWLLGLLAAGAALALHALALGGAQLSVVQPILISSLLFALPASALLEGQRPSAAEWAWAALLVVGLGSFLALARSTGGTSQPAQRTLLFTLLGAAVLGVFAVVLGTRVLHGHRASFLGLATGVAYGIVASLIKYVITLAGSDPFRLITSWPAYTMIVIGVIAVVLNQAAYQAGPLAEVLPPLTLADPTIATLIGVIAFGDRLQTSPGAIVGEILSVAAIALAVVQLSRNTPRTNNREPLSVSTADPDGPEVGSN